jgi:nucleoside-diphosphate-sugar epimerase
MTKISILGCGWLGLPLAKALVANGFEIKGSTTSIGKLEGLENLGIQPYRIALSEDAIQGDIDSFLANAEILIIDIPPKLRGVEKENFVAKMEVLVPFIEKAKIEKVLFISSTSVYADTNERITENTFPMPETEAGRQLVAAELLLQNNQNFQTTILRFGGLIGENRHPIYFLSGKKNIENPEAPINLIHQKDCIGIISRIIQKDCWGAVFNGVAPFHPTRKAYYTALAKQLSLPEPEFNETGSSVGKTILSEKVKADLDYTFLWDGKASLI